MQHFEIVSDEEQDKIPATAPRPVVRRGGFTKPLGRYTAALVLRLQQELPRIRVVDASWEEDGQRPHDREPGEHSIKL